MSDDIPLSPPMFEDPDAVIAQTSQPDAIETLKSAVARIKGVIDAGRQPGMPLSILSNVAREAPLGSLCVAFLLGVAIGRRSR